MWLYGYVAMWLCGYVAMWQSFKIRTFHISNFQIFKFQILKFQKFKQSGTHTISKGIEHFDGQISPNNIFQKRFSHFLDSLKHFCKTKPARGPQTKFFSNYCSGIPGLANDEMPNEVCEGCLLYTSPSPRDS